MTHYRLTKRGKVVLGIFVLLVVVLMVKGGVYINKHNKAVETDTPKATIPEVDIDPEASLETEEPVEVVTPSNPEETGNPEDPAVPEEPADLEVSTIPEPEKIYSLEVIEDLKQTLFVFYFEKGQSDLNEETLELLDILMEVLVAYPEEPIVIEGHVNGYPNFKQTDENLVLSKVRSKVVMKFLTDRGIENSRITVYNFGSEVPFMRQSALQHQNDRVTVYFKNHYIESDLNK